MRHRLVLVAALALALAAAAAVTVCPGEDRDRVEDYLERANAIQRRSAPAFARASATYIAFAARRLDPGRAGATLAAAERPMRATRAELARLDPPADAHELHRRLLRVFDLNIALARETTALARYVPAAARVRRPLTRANRALVTGLGGASPERAESALATYTAALDRSLTGLRRLAPPPVLDATHRAELRRLESVRALALRLRMAIARGRERRVARLLLRFRRAHRSAGGGGGIDPRSLDAYRARQRAIERAQGDVRREEMRLQRSLEG